MGGLKKIVRGATLIETLVAMTLLITTFTLSFLVITSIKRSYNNNLLTYAYIEATSILQDSDSLEIGEHEIRFPSFTLILSKEQYNLSPSLLLSKLTAISADNVVLFELASIHERNNDFLLKIKRNEKR